MTTFTGPRSFTAFGDASFRILWGQDPTGMPGWDQSSVNNVAHVPGSDTNILFLMGLGPITRTFRVFCETSADYHALQAMIEEQATLRVPAAMNRLNVPEVNFSGDIYAEIPDVVLLSLTNELAATDGTTEADASFIRTSRPE